MCKRRKQMNGARPRCYTQTWWQKVEGGEWENKSFTFWQRSHLWRVRVPAPGAKYWVARAQLEAGRPAFPFERDCGGAHHATG